MGGILLVQQQCIPQAILGMDVLCQAKSGMGKTAVFVLSTLQELDVDETKASDDVLVIVIAHTRELAYQIQKEYRRFAKYMPSIRTAVCYGGEPYAKNVETLKTVKPQVVVGTPGRLLQLVNESHLKLGKVKHFILDECDQVLEKPGTPRRPRRNTAGRLGAPWATTALSLEGRAAARPGAAGGPIARHHQTCAPTSRPFSRPRRTRSR